MAKRRFRPSKISLLLAAFTVLAPTAVACSSSSAGTSNGSTSQAPELSTVNVYTLLIPDSAPLIIAQQKGYFAQQGLKVQIHYIAGTNDLVPLLLSHTLDFSLENYVGAFAEMAKNPALGIRIITDDLQAAPSNFDIMVPGNSKITSLAQLKGKKIAFPSLGVTPGVVALNVQLRGYGVKASSYSTAVVPFQSMLQPLAKGSVDAAFATQPFITLMESQIGAHPLADLMSGSMANFPLAGWGTSAWFEQRYPKTVAAFQRAMEKALRLAASNPAVVRQALPTYIKGLKPQIASVMPLSTYNTTLNATRLQRVADVLAQGGYVPASFNVKPLLIPLPPGA